MAAAKHTHWEARIELHLRQLLGGFCTQSFCRLASPREPQRSVCPQEDALRGKGKVQASIEELERLLPLLKEALKEEKAAIEDAAADAARASGNEAAAAKVAQAEQVSLD